MTVANASGLLVISWKLVDEELAAAAGERVARGESQPGRDKSRGCRIDRAY